MATQADESRLRWQTKTVLLLVAPWTVVQVLLQARWWMEQLPVVAWTTLGISVGFGLLVWRLRAATFGGAALGAAITAALMFSTARFPYPMSWLHGGLPPLMTLFVLTYVVTRVGQEKKSELGTAERTVGRSAGQVAANLGGAVLVASVGELLFSGMNSALGDVLFPTLFSVAALAEAAADTASSEVGQVVGGVPRLITTMRRVETGADGGVTAWGTLAGILAGAVVAVVGAWAAVSQAGAVLPGLAIAVGSGLALSGAVAGLLFDSLLGATVERRGWLNNDAVNFISTLVAAGVCVVAMAAFLGRFGRG